ncbi:hypothetical protein Tcan_03462 [Toxocara canis]|uniref:Serpentine receptor class gamma n=1 Tax=Toxocara canis TaxID=6265 RepID=A0A0B2VJQ3_TOXCA|nr:hypothetical protein Tcan_03462 [Toxocara canis]
MIVEYKETDYEETIFGIRAELIVGTVYLTTSTLCLVPLLLILKLFTTEKDMRSNVSYTIMFHIGISDVIQLSAHIASAVFVFWQSTFHPLVDKVPS